MKSETEGFFRCLEIERSYSTGTIEAYRLDLDRGLLPFLHQRGISESREVTSEDIRAYLDFLARGRGNSSAARARKLAAIKSFFKYLVDIKKLEASPAAPIRSPKIIEREPSYLNEDECLRLLQAVSKSARRRVKKRDMAIIMLFLQAGVRVSELANLKSCDVDLINGCIRVMRKGKKEQYLHLNRETVKVLASYLASRPEVPNGKFFGGPDGRHIDRTTIYRLVGKYLSLASIKKNKQGPHLLRHTFCTRLHQKGVDPLVIRDLAGHKNIATTMRYVRIENDEQIAAIRKLEFGVI